MKFFVPAANEDEQAERVYSSIAQFVDAPVTGDRVWKLRWRHNGMDMSCEVGNPMPEYYRTGAEPVLAIYACGNLFKICTPNRGGVRGEPIYAGNDHNSSATLFDGAD